jgi:hypothetical protein
MTTRYKLSLLGLALVGALIGGCSSNAALTPTLPGASKYVHSSQTVYKQIELLSRPAVKEAFELFRDHNRTNRSEPYDDPVLQRQIKSFTLAFRSKRTPKRCRPCSIPT